MYIVIRDCAIIVRKGGLKNELQMGNYYVVSPFAKAELVQPPPPPPLDLLIIFTNPSPHTKYNVTVEVEKLENHLRYLLSDNPACAGRFLREEYKPIKAQ